MDPKGLGPGGNGPLAIPRPRYTPTLGGTVASYTDNRGAPTPLNPPGAPGRPQGPPGVPWG